MSQDQHVFSGRYEIVRHVARGGMAQVYLARDLLLDRPVALKVLFPELSVDESFVERFRREAQAAANLSHPNIVSIYDWGQGDRTYFIVMEFIDGYTLSSAIRQGPLDAGRAAHIGLDVASALEFAHRRGVIHRDVKPGNVLIDSSGQVKVTDFGIARAVGAQEGLTQTGSVMGTATYFSPEQAQGHPVDVRSDIYSLGVVLYEMVVGRPPFAGDSPVSIAYQHVRETPVPPAQANPAVPAAYDAVVMKAMAKDPSSRYQTAEELREDLARFLAGQPVLAGSSYAATGVAPVMGAAVGAASTQVQPAVGGDGSRPPAEKKKRSDRAGWIALAILALIAAGVGIFLIGRSAGWWSSGKTLVVPDVTGKSVPDATNQLTHEGFTDIGQQAETSNSPNGTVIRTSPAAGAKAKSSDRITLVVSSGAATKPVPSVVGQSQQAATTALQADGFKVNITTMSSNTVPTGNVITTNPPPGSQAAVGSAVQLVVSTGQPQVPIPSLVNQDPVTASSTLVSLGLKAQQQNEYSQAIPVGQVTRTNPPAGASVAVGTLVTVFVSKGPAPVSVPDLHGLTQSQANQALVQAGLVGQFSTQPVTNPSMNGVVISQTPGANVNVSPNSTVNVVIGTYTPPPSTTSTTSTTTASTTSSTT
jgi:serine/threonine-protein kinase